MFVRGDAFGNMRRAEAFNRLRNLAQLKQPVDPIEWPINPQIPGAIIMFQSQRRVFLGWHPTASLFRLPRRRCLEFTAPPAPAWPTKSVTASTNSAVL